MDPENKLRLKSKDWIEVSPEMESGITPEKLLPANDRFCRLVRFPIPDGNDKENKLLETSKYCSLSKELISSGIIPLIELLAIDSFTSIVRFTKTLKSASAERPKLSRTTPATCPPLQTIPFQEEGQPLKSMDSSFHEFNT
uniref:Uncharacterized protein n=1 Tax=Opuntia streptacantha TaxID=393608 RepID=A0A7C9AKX6_OPUST